jgi:RNA polymerase sigma-70 factor (ECF subfamily)
MRKQAGKLARQKEHSLDFDAIYREQMRLLYAFVAYRVGNRFVAEDITSQAFEKAWKSRDSYDPGRASISSWLFTIARNCVID